MRKQKYPMHFAKRIRRVEVGHKRHDRLYRTAFWNPKDKNDCEYTHNTTTWD